MTFTVWAKTDNDYFDDSKYDCDIKYRAEVPNCTEEQYKAEYAKAMEVFNWYDEHGWYVLFEAAYNENDIYDGEPCEYEVVDSEESCWYKHEEVWCLWTRR